MPRVSTNASGQISQHLTPNEIGTIYNALMLAADLYRKDAEAVSVLAGTFERQAERADRLASEFELAAEVLIRTPAE